MAAQQSPPGLACALGIDLGTTSVKAALVVAGETGPVVAESCSRETGARADSPAAGPQVGAALRDVALVSPRAPGLRRVSFGLLWDRKT